MEVVVTESHRHKHCLPLPHSAFEGDGAHHTGLRPPTHGKHSVMVPAIRHPELSLSSLMTMSFCG